MVCINETFFCIIKFILGLGALVLALTLKNDTFFKTGENKDSVMYSYWLIILAFGVFLLLVSFIGCCAAWSGR